MTVTAFAHYNLSAHRDLLDALRDFYVNVVGLRLGDRPALRRFGYWLYAGDAAALHLSEASPGDTRLRQVSGTFNHGAFLAVGFRSAQQRLADHGVVVRVAEDPLLHQRQLFFLDPAGNGVELAFDADDEG